jgi:hypothetical protein
VIHGDEALTLSRRQRQESRHASSDPVPDAQRQRAMADELQPAGEWNPQPQIPNFQFLEQSAAISVNQFQLDLHLRLVHFYFLLIVEQKCLNEKQRTN